jgi:hypothetical protein
MTEGWMAEKPYHAPRYHYIQNTRSICGRYGLYMGELTPDAGSAVKGRADCAECFKRLRKLRAAEETK